VPEFRARLEAALGSAYRIESELGGGGMSRVFLAVEVALLRQVVVKVLPPEMAAGVNEDRFRREIQLAAGLQHPHIVPLLSAGASDDLLWYTMPFIEGESLRKKLAREGELPVEESIRILREVADALAYAHAKGVVHRDIKPDNVMISGNHALVTDFGVAKAVSESTGAHALTSVGMALGTPAYMAPEQAAGDTHVDHRADLYALGAMAYEMLTGQPPFTGPTPQALLAAHLTQAPTPVSGSRPAVPPALEGLVMRCLEKRAADRWQQARDLLPQFDALTAPSGSVAATKATPVLSSGTEAALRQTHPVRVGALFAIAAVVTLTVTWWLVQELGLPDWVVTGAGVLLVLGLPIVVLAAKHERRRILDRTEGKTVTTPPGIVGRLTTFKGALTGGGLAFSGLAVGTAAFMGLRILGIGPFATLVSAGVLEERGLLVVADFETSAEDSTIAASITEALKIDLGQSPMVRLVEGQQIGAALERMELPVTTKIGASVAQDIAQREGAKAFVAGEVSRLGDGFVLSVRLTSSVDGSTLLGVRESATDAAGLIPAVDRISRRLREGIGESLRSIRSGEPLEQVTTGSLEALRLYTQAQRARDAGQIAEGIRLWEQAIAADSGFAMAWRKLSVQLSYPGGDPARSLEAAQRAYDLRDRLPRREADLATAFLYHRMGNRQEAIRAYERLLTSWPDDVPSRNNLSIMYNQEGRYSDAERLLRVATDSGAIQAALYDNLIDAQLFQRKYEAAESTAILYGKTVPSAADQAAYFRSIVAFTRGDYDKTQAIVDTIGVSGDAVFQGYVAFQTGRLLTLRGRVEEATAHAERQQRRLEEVGLSANAGLLRIELGKVLIEAVKLGRTEEAGRALEVAVEKYPLDSVPPLNRNHAEFARIAALVGRSEIASSFYADYRATVPEATRETSGEDPWLQATIAATRSEWPEVIRLARISQRRFGCPMCLGFEIGTAFERLNEPDSALAVYEEFVTRPIYWDVGQEHTLPIVLLRLAELHEARGNKSSALEYYGRLVDLWEGADEVLQPRVAEFRRRISKLAGEPD
jgi:tetratricopeptide (TPR) repeat protein